MPRNDAGGRQASSGRRPADRRPALRIRDRPDRTGRPVAAVQLAHRIATAGRITIRLPDRRRPVARRTGTGQRRLEQRPNRIVPIGGHPLRRPRTLEQGTLLLESTRLDNRRRTKRLVGGGIVRNGTARRKGLGIGLDRVRTRKTRPDHLFQRNVLPAERGRKSPAVYLRVGLLRNVHQQPQGRRPCAGPGPEQL